MYLYFPHCFSSIQILWLPSALQRRWCKCVWVVPFPPWVSDKGTGWFDCGGITSLPRDIRKSPQHSRHPDNRMIGHWWMWFNKYVFRMHTNYTLTSLTFLFADVFFLTVKPLTTLYVLPWLCPIDWPHIISRNNGNAKMLTRQKCNTELRRKEMDSFIDTLSTVISWFVCNEKYTLFASHTT